MSLSTQAGRGVAIVSSAAAPSVPSPDSNKPVAVGPAPSTAAAVPANSQPAASTTPTTVAQTATGQQPKIPLHLNSQMTVNQARNAVRTGEFSAAV